MSVGISKHQSTHQAKVIVPTKEHVSILDDEHVFEMMQDVGRRYAENPFVVGLSGRLLIVARRQE